MSQWARFGLFFLSLTLVVGGLNVFVHRRITRAFSLGPSARRWLAALLALGLAGMVLGRVLGRGLGSALSGGAAVLEVGVIVSAALLLLQGVILSAAGTAYARWARRGATAPPALDSTGDEGALGSDAATKRMEAESPEADRVVTPAPGDSLSRRELLSRASASAALVVGGGSAVYGGIFGRHDYALEEVPIRLARLPRSLDGFTIAQLSDLHIGTFVGEFEMARAVELVKRAKPDLIAITGDMVDHDPSFADDLGRLTRMLGEVAEVVAIPGNHDHYAGVATVLDRIRRGGGTALDNRGVRVGEGRIFVAGVDDLWGRRFRLGKGPDLDEALRGRDPDVPCVLLAHQPAFFEEASSRVDLQLSGHTHGGQFNLGFRPADYVLPFGWVAGRYERGDAQLYVNRGFGTAGPPTRVGAAPEVTRIVLTV